MIKTYNIFILHISRRCSLTQARALWTPPRRRQRRKRNFGFEEILFRIFRESRSWGEHGVYGIVYLDAADAQPPTQTRSPRVYTIYRYNMRNQFVGIIFRRARARSCWPVYCSTGPPMCAARLQCTGVCIWRVCCALNSVGTLEIITVGQCHGANGEIWTVRYTPVRFPARGSEMIENCRGAETNTAQQPLRNRYTKRGT